MRLFPGVALIAALVVGLTVLAGCGGGSSSSSSGNSTTTESGSGAAESSPAAEESESAPTEGLAEAPPTTAPTTIPITTPLSKAPPKGKKVIFLQCELPICQLYTDGMKEATEALGWQFEAQVFKSTEPEKGLQQAISQHPDYIGITGLPASLLKQQLKAAEQAGIGVVSCGAAAPEKPGEEYAADCGHTLVRDAEYGLAWITNDSGGEANILGVSISQYPSLNSETEYLAGPELASVCPQCTFEELDVTPEEIGAGTVPQKVAGYLQAHPDINYLYFTFNDLAIGVPQVLESSGLSENVTITGGAATASVIKEIPDPMAAWTTEPVQYSGWVMADAMARMATGEELTQEYRELIATNPSWLLETKEAADSLKSTGYEWPGPEGFQEQFKQLWGVG